MAFLKTKGVPESTFLKMLEPLGNEDGRPGQWMIGYSRSLGATTILDCSKSFDCADHFLKGQDDVAVLKLPKVN